MEFVAAIANGGWSSLGGMYTCDEEADFMSQLLANCSVTHEQMLEASISAIPFAICPSHELLPTNMEGIDQGSYYSEIANLYFSNGSGTHSISNNEHCYISDSRQIMQPNYHDSEAFRVWDANSTNLFHIQGEEYGMDHHQGLGNGNVEEYSGTNQPGAALYEKLIQLKRESDHETTVREPERENEVMVSENSKKRPCSSVEVQKKKRNVKSKKGQKAVLTVDIEDNDGSTEGQSSSSTCRSRDASHRDLSGGVSPSSLSPKGLADLDLNGKTKGSGGSATDSQSIYARKRREKINARLRILQNLVPNGTKVDISTMLEEAVQYVKFLQLQIKLLSSDDMWMYAPVVYNGLNIGINLNS